MLFQYQFRDINPFLGLLLCSWSSSASMLPQKSFAHVTGVNFELVNWPITLATPINASCASALHLEVDTKAMFSLCMNIDATGLSKQVWYDREQLPWLSFCERLGRLPCQHSVPWSALHLVLLSASWSPWARLFCTLPYCSDPSQTFRKCIFYALQVMTCTNIL